MTVSLAFSPGRSPNLNKVDPRLVNIMAAAASGLPDGYRVTVSEGYNPVGHVPDSQHHISGRGALDLQIWDAKGNPIANKGADKSGMYKLLAQNAYGYMLDNYPELKGKLAWGGSFGTGRGSRVPDLMHFDIGGERGDLMPHLSKLGRPGGNPIAYSPTAVGAASAAADLAAGQPSRTLRKGATDASSNGAVSRLQQQLANKGYNPGPIDGKYGPRTATAVRNFEADNHLNVDQGVAGPQVLGMLGGGNPTQDITSAINVGHPGGFPDATPDRTPLDIAFGRTGMPWDVPGGRTGLEGSPELAGGSAAPSSLMPINPTLTFGGSMPGASATGTIRPADTVVDQPPSGAPPQAPWNALAGARMPLPPSSGPADIATGGWSPNDVYPYLDHRAAALAPAIGNVSDINPLPPRYAWNRTGAEGSPELAGQSAPQAPSGGPRFFAGPGPGDTGPPGMPSSQPSWLQAIGQGLLGPVDKHENPGDWLFGSPASAASPAPVGTEIPASASPFSMPQPWGGTDAQSPDQARQELQQLAPPDVPMFNGQPITDPTLSGLVPFRMPGGFSGLPLTSTDPSRQAGMSAAGVAPPLSPDELARRNYGYQPNAAYDNDMQFLSGMGRAAHFTPAFYAPGRRESTMIEDRTKPQVAAPDWTTPLDWMPGASFFKSAMTKAMPTPESVPYALRGIGLGSPGDYRPLPAVSPRAEAPMFGGKPITDTTLSGLVPFGAPASIGSSMSAPGRVDAAFGPSGGPSPLGTTPIVPGAPGYVTFDQSLAKPFAWGPGPTAPDLSVSSAGSRETQARRASDALHAIAVSGAGHSSGNMGSGTVNPSSYGGSPGSYGFSGFSPWGTATYNAPYGQAGYSNSQFTPNGWTAPNFSPSSGGSTYSYHYDPQTGQGSFIDSHGNQHNYTSY